MTKGLQAGVVRECGDLKFSFPRRRAQRLRPPCDRTAISTVAACSHPFVLHLCAGIQLPPTLYRRQSVEGDPV